jgi:hypothetical protein
MINNSVTNIYDGQLFLHVTSDMSAKQTKMLMHFVRNRPVHNNCGPAFIRNICEW